MVENKKVGYKVSFISIIINIFLSIIKMVAGIISNSSAMFSDAIHSMTDVLSNIVVIIGVKLSNKEADKEHPYGHEKIESVAAIILSGFLFVTSLSIGYNGLMSIIKREYLNIEMPGVLALFIALLCVIIKESMYWYVRYYAKKIDSSTLMADAWHHRSDALSSIGSFIGIFISRLGYPIFDSIAAIIICLFILKAAIDIFRDATNRLIDRACDEKIVLKIKEIIEKDKRVMTISSIKTRLFGNKIYVDIEIQLHNDLTLLEANDVAINIHDKIELEFSSIKHCMIYTSPGK